MNSLTCVLYLGIVLLAQIGVVFFSKNSLKVGGVIQSVDKGQFVNYFLSFGICQRIAIYNNMDRRMPELM